MINGKISRVNLIQIVKHPSGQTRWLRNGIKHRDDGPAIIGPITAEEYMYGNDDGSTFSIVDVDGQQWFLNGRRHRIDGPAIIFSNGGQEWYVDDEIHRDDGPALIYSDGTEEWYQHGMSHREDGPASIFPDGTYEWYLHGELHRIGGPAVRGEDGTLWWYVNGECVWALDPGHMEEGVSYDQREDLQSPPYPSHQEG